MRCGLSLIQKQKKCVFIGYSLKQKGYKCYNPTTHDVTISKDVVFDEMASQYFNIKDKKSDKRFVLESKYVKDGKLQNRLETIAWDDVIFDIHKPFKGSFSHYEEGKNDKVTLVREQDDNQSLTYTLKKNR